MQFGSTTTDHPLLWESSSSYSSTSTFPTLLDDDYHHSHSKASSSSDSEENCIKTPLTTTLNTSKAHDRILGEVSKLLKNYSNSNTHSRASSASSLMQVLVHFVSKHDTLQGLALAYQVEVHWRGDEMNEGFNLQGE